MGFFWDKIERKANPKPGFRVTKCNVVSGAGTNHVLQCLVCNAESAPTVVDTDHPHNSIVCPACGNSDFIGDIFSAFRRQIVTGEAEVKLKKKPVENT